MSDGHAINELLAKAAAEMPAVGKGGVNTMQNYKFRGIEQLIDNAKAVLSKHGITVIPRVKEMLLHEQLPTKSGGMQTHVIMTYEHAFVAPDGSCLVAVTLGEGMDSSDKACNKAHSQSLKYALNEVLFVAYDMAEGDADHPTAEAPSRPVTVKKKATGAKINKAQIGKLHAAIAEYATKHGKDAEEIKAKIKGSFGVESTKDMTTSQLDAVLKKLEG